LGSSCIYPKYANQPLKEDALLTGPLEPTNEPYAIAKIAGIKMIESYNRQYRLSHGIEYRAVMPTNLYGPGDTYHPENSHVIPALIQRFHNAKINELSEVKIWGSGNARREFLYVEDMARASVYLMNIDFNIFESISSSKRHCINVGYGVDIKIRDLAYLIKEVIGFKGSINFDSSKPDGSPRKLLNSDFLRQTGFKAKYDLTQGLINTYQNYLLKI
jgi:GDP-L-fucose synthase